MRSEMEEDEIGTDMTLFDELGAAEAAEREADEKRESVQNVVRRAVEEAVRHYEENVEPAQKEATDYYYGREFGNEIEERSQVVSTDVRDITLAQIPSLVAALWGPDNVVEFRARSPEKEDAAHQATLAVRYIIEEENNGFLDTVATLKDGLVRRLGWWTWWWGNEERTESLEYTGLTEDEIHLLAAEESVDEDSIEVQQYEITMPPSPGDPNPQPMPFYNVRLQRREVEGRVYVSAVPPEEVGYTPNAKSLDDAPCFYRRRYVPVDLLRARGISDEAIERAVLKTSPWDSGGLEATRQHSQIGLADARSVDALDDSQRPVLFTEAYVLVAVSYDDTRAERRLFECLGPDYEIVNGDGLGECVDEIPFAEFTPEPEPHMIEGLSNKDLVGDIQKINSQIERATLDSLAEAVNPVTIVLTGHVNMSDLTKPDASRIVRVTKDVNNSIREVKSTFVGPDTLPMIAFYNEKQQKRTGVHHGASELDADALQSTDKQAVRSVLTAKQARLEMVARVYAETTMKRLFKGVYRLFCRHQTKPKWMRLLGKWVPVDPRSWGAMMDVSVSTGLGQGTPADRIAALGAISASTKELLAAGSPLVSNVELRRVLARGYRMAGFNPDEFLKPWGPNEEAAFQQSQQQAAAQQQPPVDQQLVTIEGQKAQASAAIDAEKLELERLKIELEDDRERDKMAQELVLKERELELKYAADLADMEIKQQVANRRAEQGA